MRSSKARRARGVRQTAAGVQLQRRRAQDWGPPGRSRRGPALEERATARLRQSPAPVLSPVTQQRFQDETYRSPVPRRERAAQRAVGAGPSSVGASRAAASTSAGPSTRLDASRTGVGRDAAAAAHADRTSARDSAAASSAARQRSLVAAVSAASAASRRRLVRRVVHDPPELRPADGAGLGMLGLGGERVRVVDEGAPGASRRLGVLEQRHDLGRRARPRAMSSAVSPVTVRTHADAPACSSVTIVASRPRPAANIKAVPRRVVASTFAPRFSSSSTTAAVGRNCAASMSAVLPFALLPDSSSEARTRATHDSSSQRRACDCLAQLDS